MDLTLYTLLKKAGGDVARWMVQHRTGVRIEPSLNLDWAEGACRTPVRWEGMGLVVSRVWELYETTILHRGPLRCALHDRQKARRTIAPCA